MTYDGNGEMVSQPVTTAWATISWQSIQVGSSFVSLVCLGLQLFLL